MAKRSTPKHKIDPRLKSVEVAVHVPEAKEVQITGDFFAWKNEGVPMQKGPYDIWKVQLQLAPGEYQYRLIVDGEWRNNPASEKRVPNSLGSQNDILTVEN